MDSTSRCGTGSWPSRTTCWRRRRSNSNKTRIRITMENQIVEIDMANLGHGNPAWIAALEAGKVLYFPNFAEHGFKPQKEELALFREDIRDPKSRNISLDSSGKLKGAVGDDDVQAMLSGMI